MAKLAGMVLAAGRGTRIAALGRLRPKPLLPVGDTTPFARAVEALRRGGASNVVANAAHLAHEVERAAAMLGVEVSTEDGGPFGTAGAIAHARSRLDADRVVIWNGDVVADVDLSKLLAAHVDGVDATLAVLAIGAPGSGNVGIDDRGRVVRLRHESFSRETNGAEFAAVHVVGRAVVDRCPARGCIVGDVYLPMLREGAELRAVACVDRWHDVGDLRRYLAANVERAFVAGGVTIPPEITLDRCAIGEGARLVGEGSLREVVVWPGCTARAPLERAIVVDGDEVISV